VTLYNTNTDTRVDQLLRVEDGDSAVRGDYAIDGIAGTGTRADSAAAQTARPAVA
jgi:2-methylaconitate cis-trans-isomerase PrpF